MAIHGFDSDKCNQRNRVAAARFGVNAVPVRFRGSAADDLARDGFVTLQGVGELPDSPEACLALINAAAPQGAEPLKVDDVYIHFLEAANSNFVTSYFLTLDQTTLKNIAAGGRMGVSFMNSHRTGTLSTPAEMPFGQTFCGRYEEGFDAKGNPARRSFVGVFLLRGAKPNGDNGPTTDDLDRMVRSGQLRDVSVGLGRGDSICDVCALDLDELTDDGEYLCPHVPGTHRSMTEEQIATQKQREPMNPNGYATFTLFNAELSEVSAVYNGAVPGAGVKKVLSFSRGADMTREDVRQFLQEAYDSYGAMLPFDLSEIVEIKNSNPTGQRPSFSKSAAFAANGGTGMSKETEAAQSNDARPDKTELAAGENPEVIALRQQVAELQAKSEADAADAKTARAQAAALAASNFATLHSAKILPANREAFAKAATDAHIFAAAHGGVDKITALCEAIPNQVTPLTGGALSAADLAGANPSTTAPGKTEEQLSYDSTAEYAEQTGPVNPKG